MTETMTEILSLRLWIDALPEPHRANAMHNYRDAWDDLVSWPQHAVSILADLEASVEVHAELAALGLLGEEEKCE